MNTPIPIKPGAVEQYKRAFARQRARDLAQHADKLLSKDKEIAALQNECRQLEAKLGLTKVGTGSLGLRWVLGVIDFFNFYLIKLQHSSSSCIMGKTSVHFRRYGTTPSKKT